MCKVKSCSRPSFVGGLCGYHALEGWCEKRQRQREVLPPTGPGHRAAYGRRRSDHRPASG